MSILDKLYISSDIETNGSVAGIHSMISCGAVAAKDGITLDTYERNILPYDDLQIDSKTMKWWSNYPEQYKLTQVDPVTPFQFCQELKLWLSQFDYSEQEVILVHHNAPFDFSFLRYYWKRELQEQLFFTALDIKALAFATGHFHSFRHASKNNIKEFYNIEGKNKHTGLADAEEQLIMLYRILEDLSNK